MIQSNREHIMVRNLGPAFVIVCYRNRRLITISNRLRPQIRNRIIDMARSLHRDI